MTKHADSRTGPPPPGLTSKDGTVTLKPNIRAKPLATGLLAAVALGVFAVPPPAARASEAGRFDGYEIRVIRPRFMQKSGRIELGGQAAVVMSQSFIYTLIASGLLDYHFNESFALELNAGYGASIDKEDKRILEDEYDINTSILRTQYQLGVGLLWTPIYGKTQLPDGDLVYFDSFLSLTAGMTGIQYLYEQCVSPAADKPDAGVAKPAPATKSYPTVNIGFGQKFFLSESVGLRWDVRTHVFPVQNADGACDPTTASGGKVQIDNTLSVGASTFF